MKAINRKAPAEAGAGMGLMGGARCYLRRQLGRIFSISLTR